MPRVVKGQKYVAADEKFDRKMSKKLVKEMKTPGIAVEFELSKKDRGYSKMPKVKPQKKGKTIVAGKRKVY
jgi:hypothetical protein